MPILWYCFRDSPVSIGQFIAAIIRPMVASIVVGIVTILANSYLPSLTAIVSIMCLFVISVMTYVLAILAMPGGLLLLKDLASYRSYLLSKST